MPWRTIRMLGLGLLVSAGIACGPRGPLDRKAFAEEAIGSFEAFAFNIDRMASQPLPKGVGRLSGDAQRNEMKRILGANGSSFIPFSARFRTMPVEPDLETIRADLTTYFESWTRRLDAMAQRVDAGGAVAWPADAFSPELETEGLLLIDRLQTVGSTAVRWRAVRDRFVNAFRLSRRSAGSS